MMRWDAAGEKIVLRRSSGEAVAEWEMDTEGDRIVSRLRLPSGEVVAELAMGQYGFWYQTNSDVGHRSVFYAMRKAECCLDAQGVRCLT
jgi:hypothetical protein